MNDSKEYLQNKMFEKITAISIIEKFYFFRFGHVEAHWLFGDKKKLNNLLFKKNIKISYFEERGNVVTFHGKEEYCIYYEVIHKKEHIFRAVFVCGENKLFLTDDNRSGYVFCPNDNEHQDTYKFLASKAELISCSVDDLIKILRSVMFRTIGT